jgi:hypothetical protein
MDQRQTVAALVGGRRLDSSGTRGLMPNKEGADLQSLLIVLSKQLDVFGFFNPVCAYRLDLTMPTIYLSPRRA